MCFNQNENRNLIKIDKKKKKIKRKMDSFQTILTSCTIIVVIILMIVYVCHYIGPKTTAWFRSNQEEKIGLSKSKIFNANGYMIHSGSDLLQLCSTGSFKRFDSIDRECKEVDQNYLSPAPWNIQTNDVQTNIPPQPLRPAPAPKLQRLPSSPALLENGNLYGTLSNPDKLDEQNFYYITSRQPSVEKYNNSTAIPRPTAKRQLSTPLNEIQSNLLLNNLNKRNDEMNTSRIHMNSNEIRKEINNENGIEKFLCSNEISKTSVTSNQISYFNKNSKSENDFKNNSISINNISTIQQEQQHQQQIFYNNTNPFLNNKYEKPLQTVDNPLAFQNNIHNENFQYTLTNSSNFYTSTDNNQESFYNNINKNPFETDSIGEQLKSYKDTTDFNNTFSRAIETSLAFNCSSNLNNFINHPQLHKSKLIEETDIFDRQYLTNKLSKSNELINSNDIIMKKYTDVPVTDANDIDKLIKIHKCRNRSYSETEITDSDLKSFSRNNYNRKSLNNTNPFLFGNIATNMQKTFSENYLAKHFGGTNFYQNNYNNQIKQNTWSFGNRTSQKYDSNYSLGRRNSSQSSLNDSDHGSLDSINLERAISCESVNSQSSVILSDLEPVIPPVTGQLCIGLQYDKNKATDEGVELTVTVMEAKELIGPTILESFDTFVRIYLVPDETGAKQTKLIKNSTHPSYNETFSFWLNKKHTRSSLWFHLYHIGSSHTLIGEAEMQISDVTGTRPLTTWLPLSDSRKNIAKWGELMFSLSYLPTAERLKVVVVKGRNFKFEQNGNDLSTETQNIFVKVYLLKDNKKVSKKRTSLKRKDRCPIFNESMIFSIPPYVLNSIQVRLTVVCVSADLLNSNIITIGHVIVGAKTGGRGTQHWNQMLSTLRKPVAFWHSLRKTKDNNLKRC